MERRALRLHSYDEVVQAAELLQARGYERAGQWGLAEVCHHLATVMELSLTGFPKPVIWPIRLIARWFFLPRMLRHQVFRRTIAAPAYLQPPANAADAQAVERLRAVLQRLQAHTGPLQPSPVFGTLSTEEWREVHLWHSEHHLSFLVPR